MGNWQWLTPDALPSGTRCILLYVPEGDDWEAIVRGALAPLFDPASFEQYGSITPDQTAEQFQDHMMDTFIDWETCP